LPVDTGDHDAINEPPRARQRAGSGKIILDIRL